MGSARSLSWVDWDEGKGLVRKGEFGPQWISPSDSTSGASSNLLQNQVFLMTVSVAGSCSGSSVLGPSWPEFAAFAPPPSTD
jgi:hypothetical protein